jgi:putative phosphoesterase
VRAAADFVSRMRMRLCINSSEQAKGVKRRRVGSVPKLVHARRDLQFDGSTLRIVAVADTHGRPHPQLGTRIAELTPAHILHAGDVGNLAVLRDLEEHAPVTAVRGNVDGRDLPDLVTITVRSGERVLLNILLTHVAVYGPNLRADVARTAHSEDAPLVVCGHSHVPFAAHDKGITVFNPGSVGPRRFQLPIVLGVIDVSADRVSVHHVDCETGLAWRP